MKRRRGVTLLITLSVIATMIALVGILFGYLETARQQAVGKAATVQASLLRADLQKLLEKNLKSSPSIDILQKFYNVPLGLFEKKGAFTLVLLCKPELDRVPIAWLALEGNATAKRRQGLARDLLAHLGERAELRDPERLYQLIRQALKGNTPRFGETGWIYSQPGILDAKTFRRILEDYRYQADDPGIDNVKWEKFFAMDPSLPVPQKLDGDFLAPDLTAYLFNLDPGFVKSDYTPGNLKNFLRENGSEEDLDHYRWLLSSRPPLTMSCRFDYRFREKQYNYSFEYRNGRIGHFERETE